MPLLMKSEMSVQVYWPRF